MNMIERKCFHCRASLAGYSTQQKICWECEKTAASMARACVYCGCISAYLATDQPPQKCSACNQPYLGMNTFSLTCGCGVTTSADGFWPRRCVSCHSRLFAPGDQIVMPDPKPVPTPAPSIPSDPPIHCACCNQKAPMIIGMLHMRSVTGLLPKTDGWMRMFFPWSDEKAGQACLLECSWLCPPCGTEVAKFIAHRKMPMLGDEDLIG